MQVTQLGGKSFSFLKVDLTGGESIFAESGAMTSMDPFIDLRAKLKGGFFSALMMKFFGKEALFVSVFKNTKRKTQSIYLTQKYPGEICEAEIKNETLYIQQGSFIAHTKGVNFSLSWAGWSSKLAGEGLFRLRVSGSGKVWYGSYGAVVEKYVNGQYIVDNGHLLSYPKNIKLSIKLSGGIFSSFFGGEGLVLRLSGKGKIKLQTRSVGGLVGWLNQRFY